MLKAMRHLGIVVTDIEESLSFYRDILGLSVEKDFSDSSPYIDRILGLKGVKLRMVKLTTDDGTMIELLKFESHPSEIKTDPQLNNIGCTHMAFTVENIDETYKLLTSKNVEFKSPPETSGDGYARVAFCKDPDGFFIELVEVL